MRTCGSACSHQSHGPQPMKVTPEKRAQLFSTASRVQARAVAYASSLFSQHTYTFPPGQSHEELTYSESSSSLESPFPTTWPPHPPTRQSSATAPNAALRPLIAILSFMTLSSTACDERAGCLQALRPAGNRTSYWICRLSVSFPAVLKSVAHSPTAWCAKSRTRAPS